MPERILPEPSHVAHFDAAVFIFHASGMFKPFRLAISMMRAGHLRLAPHPVEVGRHPYNHRFKLWRALWCVWKEWRRERLHN